MGASVRGRALSLMVAVAVMATLFALAPAPAQAEAAPAAPGVESRLPDEDTAKPDAPPSPPRRPDPEPEGKKTVGVFDPAKAKLVERRATSDLFENPDGTRTLRAYAGVANWRDSAGRWQAIDPSLVADGEKGFKNRSGAVSVGFAKRADAAALVRSSTKDWSIAFGMDGAKVAGEPVVEGQSIRYTAVAEGVDLVYTLGTDHLKEVLVLARPLAAGAPSTFRFPLTLTGGVEPRTEADGTIAFYDGDTLVATIPQGTMSDSSGDEAAGRSAAWAPVATRLVRDKGRFALELAPERSWLDDPARQYPVNLDPNHQFYAALSTPATDAFVGSGCGNCTYNGAAQFDGSYVNKIGYSTYNGGSWEWRSYLAYDVQPANGADIIRADWYGYFYSTSAANATFVMRPTGAVWNDLTVNWANQPGGCCDNVFGAANGGQWTSRDIRTWVHNWTHGLWTNTGIEMDNYWQGQYLRMGAYESGAQRSFIDVTYNHLANTPTYPSPSFTWQNTTTPKLCATYDDVNEDPGYLRFDIYNSAGTFKGAAITPWVDPEQQACATVPAGWLGEGNMWYHAFAFDGYNWSSGYADVWLGIDTTKPPTPVIAGSPHASPLAWYAERTLNATWPAPGDPSGISGYAVAAATTSPTEEAGYATTQIAAGSTQTVGSDGTWYLNVRAKDGAGNWSDNARFAFNVDATKPAPPTVTPEAPHVCNAGSGGTWSADSTPTFAFSASDVAPVTAYAYEMDQVATTVPNQQGPAGPYTSVTRADGSWWFHVRARNAAGLWSETAHCKVLIDAGSPSAPVARSTSHPAFGPDDWYQSRTAHFTWEASTSISPVVAYDHALDPEAENDPDGESTVGAEVRNATYTDLADGVSYFHVNARNAAGRWGPSGHVAVHVDGTAPTWPADAQISSVTHPALVGLSNDRATATWTAASDATAGIASYYWEFNQDPQAPAGTAHQSAATNRTATSDPLAPGSWYFHVRPVDKAGNVGEDRSYGPIVVDPSGPLGLSITLPPLAEAASDQLGLEQFAPYRSVDLGTATGYVHLGTGNLVVTQDETTIPRQGLSAVVRRVYNSTDPRDPDGMGPGWRLSVTEAEGGLSGLAESVTTLDAAAPVLVANLLQATGQVLEFSDGDGTTHRFVRPGAPGTRWESPPGVNLRLREVAGGYELIRPDGVTYQVTNKGSTILPAWRVTSVSDRSGNRLTYHIDPVGPLGALRLTGITHSRDDERLVTFTYPSGRLGTIVSLPGQVGDDPATDVVETNHDWQRTTQLEYDAAGLSVTRNANHTLGQQQETRFTYANGLLSTVVDGLGKTTTIGYDGAGTAARVATVTDREEHELSFDYGVARPEGPSTKVTDPMAASTFYTVSPRAPLADGRMAGGNIVAIVDAGTEGGGPVRSSYQWDANRQVSSTDGVGNTTLTTYDDLGLVRSVTRPAPNDAGRGDLGPGHPTGAVTTTLSYRYPNGFAYPGCTEPPVEQVAVSTEGWCQMVADLTSMVAADDLDERVTEFAPDDAGRVSSVVRRAGPTGTDRAARFEYFDSGSLCKADGPRDDVSDVTRFGDAATTTGDCGPAAPHHGGYDPSGGPQRVLDARGNASDVVYTPYGQPAHVTDRDGRVTRAFYDARGNLLRLVDDLGAVTEYSWDANDNRRSETSPRGTATAEPDDFQTRYRYDDNDRLVEVSRPGKDESSRSVATIAYNGDGTTQSETNPVGGITEYSYHPNRMLKEISAPAATGHPAKTTFHYDAAGRMVRSERPAVAQGDQPPRPVQETEYTPQGQVSLRRETSDEAGQWRTTRFAYNAHGEQTSVSGPRAVGNAVEATEHRYNAFGEVDLVSRRLDEATWAHIPTAYDAAGNAVATNTVTGTGQLLTTTYRFDELGRVEAQTSDPSNPGHEVTFSYENEGAQLSRVDLRQVAGPQEAACGDDGVVCEPVRTVTSDYYDDGTMAWRLATDDNGAHLLSCYGDGQDPQSGYDADKRPVLVRTFTAPTSCEDGQNPLRQVTMDYDHRGLLSSMTQAVQGDSGLVSRTQSFEHRADATLASATHDGFETTYGRSPAGWTESVEAQRQAPPPSPPTLTTSTFSYSPAGALLSSSLGAGAATSVRTPTLDGMPASLVWTAGGATVRSHTGIDYDEGGLRTSEAVSVAHSAGTSADTGGTAEYTFDLGRRLTSYDSPYLADAADAVDPSVYYRLDQGGNITNADTRVDGQHRVAENSQYPNGRLTTRQSTLSVPGQPAVETATAIDGYSALGEETHRTVTVSGSASVGTTTSYDAAGHVAKVEPSDGADVSYVYDGADHLLARRVEGGPTTLYFYWGAGTTLAEETDGSGDTLVRYVVDGGRTLAQHRFARTPEGDRDTADSHGSWSWLLDDPAGNVATHVDDAGTVLEQAAFDPYGAPAASGASRAANQTPGTAGSSLGFQGSLTDPDTDKVILGPRQYDPGTARFTNPDVYVGAEADIALGADPLTGNRYLFAAANPVAYYEDGHGIFDCPFGDERKERVATGYKLERRERWVENPNSPGGGFVFEYDVSVPAAYETKTTCVRNGTVGQFVDYSLGNDISRASDPTYSNVFRDLEQVVAANAPRYGLACAQGVGMSLLTSFWLGWVALGKSAYGCVTDMFFVAITDLQLIAKDRAAVIDTALDALGGLINVVKKAHQLGVL